jgi:hypothetical protein
MLCSRVERKDAEQDAGSLAVEVKNKYHSSRGKPFTLLCFALLCSALLCFALLCSALLCFALM